MCGHISYEKIYQEIMDVLAVYEDRKVLKLGISLLGLGVEHKTLKIWGYFYERLV